MEKAQRCVVAAGGGAIACLHCLLVCAVSIDYISVLVLADFDALHREG